MLKIFSENDTDLSGLINIKVLNNLGERISGIRNWGDQCALYLECTKDGQLRYEDVLEFAFGSSTLGQGWRYLLVFYRAGYCRQALADVPG